MQQKILITLCIVGTIGLIWLASSIKNNEAVANTSGTQTIVDPVRIENGVQIIHVIARGGYTPNKIVAKAGMPTKLEMETKGAYDCSASFTIPSLGYKKMLPATGVTTIDLPTQAAGSSLRGLCVMGMYSLNMQFN